MEFLKDISFSGEKEKLWLAKQAGMSERTFVLGENGTIRWEKGESGGLMILFRLQPSGAVVTKKQEERFDALPLDGCKVKNLADMVCTKGENEIGILRAKDEILSFKAFAEIEVGTIVHPKSSLVCEGNLLYGTNLSASTLVSIAAACICATKDASCPITVALVNEAANGIEDSLRVIAKRKPERLLVCSCCSADTTLQVGKGAGVCIKDGSCLIDKNEYEAILRLGNEENMEVQPFVGDTKSSLARLYLEGKTKQMAAVYLPVEEFRGRLEEIFVSDVEKTQNLVLKYAETFGII